MTGYLETLTDPSYYGQVVIQTFPLIGNYGVIPADFESDSPSLKGYIVREWCQVPSNFRCEGDLDTFLKESGIPGIYGIDTRALTRIVREYGVLNCKISYSPDVTKEELDEIKNYVITEAVESTTIKEKEHFDTEIIAELKKLCDFGIPTFGICLGHQLLALSQGAKTEKLKYGHRGANQPAKEVETGRVYITSQNHGYAVVSDSMPENGKVSFVNGNDNTCEGVNYTNMPAFSVQFHPEACGGPHDTAFLFDRFIELMKNNRK